MYPTANIHPRPWCPSLNPMRSLYLSAMNHSGLRLGWRTDPTNPKASSVTSLTACASKFTTCMSCLSPSLEPTASCKRSPKRTKWNRQYWRNLRLWFTRVIQFRKTSPSSLNYFKTVSSINCARLWSTSKLNRKTSTAATVRALSSRRKPSTWTLTISASWTRKWTSISSNLQSWKAVLKFQKTTQEEDSFARKKTVLAHICQL